MPTTNAVKLARAEELIAKQEQTIKRMTEDRDHFMVKRAEAEAKLRDAALKAKDDWALARDLALAVGALVQLGAKPLPFQSSVGLLMQKSDSGEAVPRWLGKVHDHG
jgi:hypothetical protein